MDEFREKDEFELAVEKYDMPKKSGAHVFNIENEFADVKDPLKYTSLSVRVIPIKNEILGLFKNVDDLYIGSDYKGDLSFVNDINPKRIIINKTISENELRDLRLLSVEELSICVETSANPIVIKAPRLRKLFLSGDYRDNKSRSVDLTECCALEELIIRDGIKIDVFTIGRLESLKKLCIYEGQIENLKWVAQYRNLEHMEINHCHLKDISGVEMLYKLRILDLSHNDIKSADPLSHLSELEFVNLYDNSISSSNIADKIKAVKLILTGTDYVVDNQMNLAVGAIGGVCAQVDAEFEKPIESFPIYMQKSISERRSLPRLDRIKLAFQQEFEQYYFKLSPNKAYANTDYDPLKAKEMYLRKMRSRFLFLKYTEAIKEDYRNEQVQFCRKYTDDTLIVITCKNVFAITVKYKPYEEDEDDEEFGGKIEIEIPSTRRHVSALKEVIYDLWDEFVSDLEISDYNFKIRIEMKYSGDFYSTDLAVPVMYAMDLAVNGRFKADKVLIGTFGIAENCETIPRKRYLSMAKNEGAREVLLYGRNEEWVAEYSKTIPEQYGLKCDFYEFIGSIFD